MDYQDKAIPVRTHAEYIAAKSAGARVQFTACGQEGDNYDMPSSGGGSGGWIDISPVSETSNWASKAHFWPLPYGEKVRAFYPVDVEPEETHFGIGLSTALVLGLGALAATVVFGAALVAVVIA